MLNEKKDPDRVEGGYKAMATSVGQPVGDVKKYLKSPEMKKRMKKVKERAKDAENPEAYAAAVERKMAKGHFEDLEQILDQLNTELNERIRSKHPGKDVPAKERSETVKKAKAGEDIGKPGKKFKEIEKKAAERYGSEESGKRVAAAAMWKNLRK
jgi:RNA 3'-terminal phosphate cyclase